MFAGERIARDWSCICFKEYPISLWHFLGLLPSTRLREVRQVVANMKSMLPAEYDSPAQWNVVRRCRTCRTPTGSGPLGVRQCWAGASGSKNSPSTLSEDEN